MRISLLGLALLFAFCGNVFGNTGVFAGSGHSIQLVKSADVQMVSEDVTITPITGASTMLMMHTVEFRCTFVLKNRSNKPVKIQVGFPLDRESHGSPPSPSDDADEVLSYHFIARDAKNTYHVRHVATDSQKKFSHIFLWDMDFAAGETRTLHVGYILPMSVAGSTTRKPDELPPSFAGNVNDGEKFLFHYPPEYEKPWHKKVETCMVVYFNYVTETGQSWAGPIEKATFRVSNNTFEYFLRKCPDYIGGNPADIPADEQIPEAAQYSLFGLKLGTVYRRISPEGWKPAYIPEIPPGAPKPEYEPDGIAWKFENYKPGTPLTFTYFLTGFPENAADCDPWVKRTLGKTSTKADVLELREIAAAFFGVAPQTASVKFFVEQQVWYNPKSNAKESELSKPRQAVLARLTTIADHQKNVSAAVPAVSPLIGQEPKLRAVLQGHAYQVTAVAFSPDGKTLVSASLDRKIKLWDATTMKNTATFKGHVNGILAVVFSHDGKTLASADSDGKIKLWNVASGKNTATINAHEERAESLAFSPDDKTLASASYSDTTIKLWDVATGKNTAAFAHNTYLRSVAYSPDGKTVASGGNDNVVYLWNVSTGKNTILKGHTNCIFALAFSPDGKTLASASGDNTIKLWDIATAKNTATIKDTHDVLSVTFSPDGKTLASGSQGETIKLWDVSTGKNNVTLGKHIFEVNSLAFSPDGKTLASSGILRNQSSPESLENLDATNFLNANTVKLWEIKK